MKFQVRGHGECRHACNCPRCTYDEQEWVEIDEVVEADTPRDAENIIIKREGDVLGDFSWLDGPEIKQLEE